MITLTFGDSDFKELETLFRNKIGENKFLNYNEIFPKIIFEEVADLHLKAWFIKKSINNIADEIKSSHNADLIKPYEGDLKNSIDNAKEGFILFFEHKNLILNTEVLLFEIKSFLDILAKAISKVLEIKNDIHTFQKKGTDPGGQFIDILKNNTSSSHKETAEKIIKIIEKHKKLWIDFCVHTRDTASHYKTLGNKIIKMAHVAQPPLQKLEIKTYIDENIDFNQKISDINKYFEEFINEMVIILKN